MHRPRTKRIRLQSAIQSREDPGSGTVGRLFVAGNSLHPGRRRPIGGRGAPSPRHAEPPTQISCHDSKRLRIIRSDRCEGRRLC